MDFEATNAEAQQRFRADQAVEGAMVKLGRLVPDHPVGSPRTAHEVAWSPFLRARARGARIGVVELEDVYAGTDRIERGKRAVTCLARASAWRSRCRPKKRQDNEHPSSQPPNALGGCAYECRPKKRQDNEHPSSQPPMPLTAVLTNVDRKKGRMTSIRVASHRRPWRLWL